MSVNEACKVADHVYEEEFAKCIAAGLDYDEADECATWAANRAFDEAVDSK